MIGARIHIDRASGTLHTHRDSYRLDGLSVVSVRRPLLPGGIATALVAAGFVLRFGDLLHAGEIGTTLLVGLAALVLGTQAGRLSLLSRDLRGSPLAGVVWGRAASLQRARRDIVAAIHLNRSQP